MRIALRHLPFTPEQTEHLTGMIHAAGGEALCLLSDVVPDPALLASCDALIGYYPPEMLCFPEIYPLPVRMANHNPPDFDFL